MGSTLFTKKDLPLWMQMQQNAPAQAQEQHYQDYFQRQKDISGAIEEPDMFSGIEGYLTILAPILGISKMVLTKQLSKLVTPFSWEITAEQLAKRIPRGARKEVGGVVDLVKDASKLGKSSEAMEKGGWIGMHTVGRYPSRETVIGLKTPSSVSTAGHEFGHELERKLTSEDRSLLSGWWDKLSTPEKKWFKGPEEMFAQAYTEYLGVNKTGSNMFNRYPEFIQHLIKKYHKLNR